MNKVHIRTYRLSGAGDIAVTRWNRDKREAIDLSSHYADISYDRRHGSLETAVDVFRYEDDTLAWTLTANGQNVDTATTAHLLLGLFLADVERDSGDPRAL
jgi:hypothetical protein